MRKKSKNLNKVIPIKKLLKENDINYKNFKINDDNLSLSIDNMEKFDLLFKINFLIFSEFLLPPGSLIET